MGIIFWIGLVLIVLAVGRYVFEYLQKKNRKEDG